MSNESRKDNEAAAGCFLLSALFLLCIAAGIYWGIVVELLPTAIPLIFIGLSIGFNA